ncbi:MAG: DUF4124 domain-containing protein [Burkholderiales bacterium]|nr:DUF4124 domain-containing protein [Burkholderiales bacterium]
MQKTALSFVACLLALAAAGAQASSLWKWRDASGQLHISDTAPPAGTPATSIISSPSGSAAPAASPSPAPGASAAAAPPALSALDKKKKAAEQEKADKEKAEHDAADAQNAAIRKDNCARAQSSLANLKTGQRIAVVNSKGEREIMDDAARAAEAKRAQDVVASNCGPAPASAK